MNQRSRTLVWSTVGALLVAAFGLWLVNATEWATREVWEPPQGEAATDNHFLVKRFLARVGASVESRQGLAELPPEGATLVLQARHWRFREGRAEALKAWVERGGHLLVHNGVGDDELFQNWLQVRYVLVPRPKRPTAASALAAASGASTDQNAAEDEAETEDADDEEADDEDADDEDACPPLMEPPGQPGWHGDARSYKVCVSGEFLKTRRTPEWSVADAVGPRALRLPAGRGSVTFSTGWGLPFREALLEDDQAALLAAELRLHAGQRIWLVTDEQPPGIVATLWRLAPVALLAALCALALLLWRWGTRFAPLQAVPPLARRSMAEQVRGTAAYLLRHGPAALHQAQRRALLEAAEAHLSAWRRLPPQQQAALLARHTGLAADELAQAMDPTTPRDPAATGRALALLETARRRITEAGAPTHPPPSPPEPTP